MNTKNIEIVIAPPRPHFVGDGFRVHNFIPGMLQSDMSRMDPFLLLDYNSKFYFPPSDSPRGVSVHPHRGFETVTIAYKGKVAHHDSAGNSGIIGEGDVQWMTAASGILHKEFQEEQFSKEGGEFQMVQLWVNLPAKDKMSPPKYQEIVGADIKKWHLPEDNGFIEVIAGEYNGIKGAASTFTPLHLLNAKFKKEGRAEFAFPATFNTSLLVIEGKIRVNDTQEVGEDNFALFKNDGEAFSIEALDASIVLILSGQPINEPIVARGPFVMNSNLELSQAIKDYQSGKFGQLKD